jgi:hypothetical protein
VSWAHRRPLLAGALEARAHHPQGLTMRRPSVALPTVTTIEDMADHLAVDAADRRVLVGWHLDEDKTVPRNLPSELCEALHQILDPHGERTAPAPLYWPGHPWGAAIPTTSVAPRACPRPRVKASCRHSTSGEMPAAYSHEVQHLNVPSTGLPIRIVPPDLARCRQQPRRPQFGTKRSQSQTSHRDLDSEC